MEKVTVLKIFCPSGCGSEDVSVSYAYVDERVRMVNQGIGSLFFFVLF